MVLRVLGWVVLFLLIPAAVHAKSPRGCVSADEASRALGKDICISAHIYDVVELGDGTRFLDVCNPETPDKDCHFTIVSLQEDREQVGELRKYRDMDVQVRGIVRSMHGRAGLVLSHPRQFHGGMPKFRPNPRLLRGFEAEDEKPAVHDPNIRHQGGRRSFMNTRDQVTMPTR